MRSRTGRTLSTRQFYNQAKTRCGIYGIHKKNQRLSVRVFDVVLYMGTTFGIAPSPHQMYNAGARCYAAAGPPYCPTKRVLG